jgi:hypothetical protein
VSCDTVSSVTGEPAPTPVCRERPEGSQGGVRQPPPRHARVRHGRTHSARATTLDGLDAPLPPASRLHRCALVALRPRHGANKQYQPRGKLWHVSTQDRQRPDVLTAMWPSACHAHT